MNKYYYPRLAITNIKKNAKSYIPYILTCIGTIMMFYNMCFLVAAKDIGSMSENGNLRYILLLGAIVIGIFSVIFLFYTNSFLIKQRKKEFGLFNILGMEKKHIARIMFFETLFTSLISLTSGITGGILLSKLMILLIMKIINFEASFGFEVPAFAVLLTLALFCGIFFLELIYNAFQVHLSKPVELLRGGNVGEKEPKTKWVLLIFGIICLGCGYYIALFTESPLAAVNLFFLAVVLVIAGTYCLFTAGSIALLKALRRNKAYYYKLKHFTSISGMLYRMKRNAAGLANICILSTAVIVMLSTTVSLYIGMEDLLRTRYPRNIIVYAMEVPEGLSNRLDSIIEEQAEKAGVSQKNLIRYRYKSMSAVQKGASFEADSTNSYLANGFAVLFFLTIDDYNNISGRSLSLEKGEALLYTLRGKIPGNKINFNGYELTIKEHLPYLDQDGSMTTVLSNCYYLVVDDVNTMKKVYNSLENNKFEMGELFYYCGFDIDAERDVHINLVKSLTQRLKNIGVSGHAEGPEISRESFYTIYGGLFFLGIFLGLLFIMATVLIIYYKQIAEGYDDKERFRIMQKVGMSHDEIKKSIRSQVLTVFFLPLGAAVIHICIAFKVITKLLLVFNLTNVALFAGCTVVTILIFAAVYTLVYVLTARTYYRIVS